MPKGIYKRPADLSDRISEGIRPGLVAMKARVRELYEEGLTPKNIARETGISRSTVKKWVIDLPKHQTGVTGRRHGYAAARVARLTGREGEAIRQEMEVKENDPCFFCKSPILESNGWRGSAYHHHDDGCIAHAHVGCNAQYPHQVDNSDESS